MRIHCPLVVFAFCAVTAATARADIGAPVEQVACNGKAADDPCGPSPCDLLDEVALCDGVDPSCVGACGSCSANGSCVYTSQCEANNAPESCSSEGEGEGEGEGESEGEGDGAACSDAGIRPKSPAALAMSGVAALAALALAARRKR